MYTPIFSQKTRDKSIRLAVDEYHYGDFGNLFLKRVSFLKKVKEYKKHQSHQHGLVMYLNALPKIGRWALKRTFDLFGSSIALLALLPLMILIAIIVSVGSKGPVIIGSKRVGLGYNIFNLYKFRTKPVSGNDAYELNFGEFLEDSGLDELPSLFNILNGDMSIVGSRPLQLSEAEKLTRDQMSMRLMTPVGFTGSWRIKAEDITEKQVMDLEIEYAMKNSFLIDMKILLFTFISMPLRQKV